MKQKSLLTILLLAVCAFTTFAQKNNELSKAEKKAGWKLLFDGKTPVGFHGYKQKAMPDKGWNAKDGMLVHA